MIPPSHLILQLFIVFAVVVLIQRLVELNIARRNVERMLAQGGREYGAAHYPLIIAIHLAWYIAWIVESLLRGPHLNALWPLWLALYVLAEIFRYWVIATLGPYWCMRILTVPGLQRIQHGPYRYFAHPNYLVVTVELFVIPMIFNALLTAILFTLLYLIALFALRIPAEKKAWKALSATAKPI